MMVMIVLMVLVMATVMMVMMSLMMAMTMMMMMVVVGTWSEPARPCEQAILPIHMMTTMSIVVMTKVVMGTQLLINMKMVSSTRMILKSGGAGACACTPVQLLIHA